MRNLIILVVAGVAATSALTRQPAPSPTGMTQPTSTPLASLSVSTPPVSILPSSKTKPPGPCHPNYSGCLNPAASDYDCAGGKGNGPFYTGSVRVKGRDVFGLDSDGDGWGCEGR